MSDTPRAVRFFPTCLGDPFFPDAMMAAAEVLEQAGCRVKVDPEATCCGQPAFNLGYWDEARQAARRVLDQMGDGDDPVVVPSGSCATMMHRFYPLLFAGTPDKARAAAVAARVREWSQFLRRDLDWQPRPQRGTADEGPVTLHPACHALRELGVEDEPRELLEAAGYALVDLPRADACCGFGGGFSVEMPEMSGKMLADKLGCIRAAMQQGAATVASLDAGCLMHMRGGHERAGKEGHEGDGPSCPRYVHVAELLIHSRTTSGGEDDGPPDP